MAELIWVKPGHDDGRVAFVETHADQPGGDVFVAGPPVQVAKTAKVERALAAGDIVECDAPKAAKAPVPPPPTSHPSREEVQTEVAKLRGEAVADEAKDKDKGKPGAKPAVGWNS